MLHAWRTTALLGAAYQGRNNLLWESLLVISIKKELCCYDSGCAKTRSIVYFLLDPMIVELIR
jgi:hypothetical protein